VLSLTSVRRWTLWLRPDSPTETGGAGRSTSA
jgi:hypothetical protein